MINDVVIRRHDDLKQMLDSNKDNLKLEAMKRIIGMVAKVSSLSIQFNQPELRNHRYQSNVFIEIDVNLLILFIHL